VVLEHIQNEVHALSICQDHRVRGQFAKIIGFVGCGKYFCLLLVNAFFLEHFSSPTLLLHQVSNQRAYDFLSQQNTRLLEP
jgi:ABC-type nitrate/sulfonate/bicarbonate transport system ATPase subunit